MNLSLVLLYIHLGLIPDLCFIANILFNVQVRMSSLFVRLKAMVAMTLNFLKTLIIQKMIILSKYVAVILSCRFPSYYRTHLSMVL